MAALCAHILVEAGHGFIPTIEVLLESHHGMFSLAKKKLVEAGFKVEGEKVLVAKDLTKEIPPVPTGIRIEPAADVSPVDLRALGRDVGMAPDDIEAWKPDSPQASLGVVAIRAGKPVGLCLAGSKPGEALLYEQHLGVHPSIRGQGLATAMFLAWLHRGKEAAPRSSWAPRRRRTPRCSASSRRWAAVPRAPGWSSSDGPSACSRSGRRGSTRARVVARRDAISYTCPREGSTAGG